MNPLLQRLHPYPFEALRALSAGITPNPAYAPVSLGIGEPRHPTPAFIRRALSEHLDGLAHYPATAGTPELRRACAEWVQRRHGVALDPARQVLPVNGSREALFALAQVVIDPSRANPTVVSPNPFYQIYEGAALLAGARCHFAPVDPARNFAVDWRAVPESVWADTQLLYVCSPGNPTGAVMELDEWAYLFELADRHGFVIASDECYGEIWLGDTPPLGGLEAARRLGRDDMRRLVMFTSLSKRSNVPGLRAGFVAGDAQVLEAFLLYRTYHGSAMGPAVQAASIAAWGDEAHVAENRRLYREKFDRVLPILQPLTEVGRPDAGFYLWAATPGDDVAFALSLLENYNCTVLPGSLLARTQDGHNPGRGRMRLALVAEVDACVEAAERIAAHLTHYVPR